MSIEDLCSSAPSAFADPESIVELHQMLSKLDAFVTQVAGAFETTGEWAQDGARSAASWIASRCHLPSFEARHRLRLARATAKLPETTRAWSDGKIASAHVGVLARLQRDEATRDALQEAEEMLVGRAEELSFSNFSKAAAYWAQLVDPNGAEDDAKADHAKRDVYLAQSFAGTWLGKITLPVIEGEIVATELSRIEQILYEADRAEAKEALGRDPLRGELARTKAQRTADALVEMARRSSSVAPGSRRPAPLFSVLVDFPTATGRICELASGVVVSPGALVPWLREADIERAVMTPSGRVEVGETTRLFSGATRRAIELRDRSCYHDTCEVPMGKCQVDHVTPYAEGGLTTQDNGRLACGFHNRLRAKAPPEERGP